MFVSISFLGIQRQLANANNVSVKISERVQRISDLFRHLNDEFPNLSLSRNNVMVTVNNVESPFDYKLKENDEILFMPHIGGG